LAGAGSGKTRTLTYRVAWLLDNGVEPESILLLTFTNKAAREMLARVSTLMPQETRAIWGGTFHSIGNRLLRRHVMDFGTSRDSPSWTGKIRKISWLPSSDSAGVDNKQVRFSEGGSFGRTSSALPSTRITPWPR